MRRAPAHASAFVAQGGPVGLTLTAEAADRLADLARQHGQWPSAVRVGVIAAGGSGFEYRMGLERNAGPDDRVFECRGVWLIVDSFSVEYLADVEIDVTGGDTSSGFRVNNPRVRTLREFPCFSNDFGDEH